MTAAVDWRGAPIVPGAVVVYPGRFSSSLYMVEAVVLEVPEDGPLAVEVLRENHYGTNDTRRAGTRVSLPVARFVTVLHALTPPLPTGESTTTTEPEDGTDD